MNIANMTHKWEAEVEAYNEALTQFIDMLTNLSLNAILLNVELLNARIATIAHITSSPQWKEVKATLAEVNSAYTTALEEKVEEIEE